MNEFISTIALALVWFLCAATVGSQSRPTPSKSNQTENAYQQPPANQSQSTFPKPNIVTSPTPFLHEQARDYTAQSKYGAAQYRLNRLQTWFNGLLMFFTAALVYVGGRQAYRLRQTVAATKEAVDAAKASARIATDALKIAERAYVYAHSVKIVRPLGSAECPRVAVEYKNTGHTAAKFFNATVMSMLRNDIGDRIKQIVGESAQEALTFHQSAEDWLTHGVVLPPDAIFAQEGRLTRGIVPHIPSESDVRDVIIDKRQWWFVVSSISYRDEFDTLYAIHEVFLYDPGKMSFERRDWDEAKEESKQK